MILIINTGYYILLAMLFMQLRGLLPLIKARYTTEEAKFLTGFPFSGRSLAELGDLKSIIG
jgi:hypothetical protein